MAENTIANRNLLREDAPAFSACCSTFCTSTLTTVLLLDFDGVRKSGRSEDIAGGLSQEGSELTQYWRTRGIYRLRRGLSGLEEHKQVCHLGQTEKPSAVISTYNDAEIKPLVVSGLLC